MFHRLEKGNCGGIRKLPKELVLLLHKTNNTQIWSESSTTAKITLSKTEDAASDSVSAHTQSSESHFALPKLSTRPLLWILLSMLKGNFGESLCYASNQNTDFQCSWREKDMVLWSTKNDFCVLFILWGEVTSKEDRKTANEVELPGCRMVFKLWSFFRGWAMKDGVWINPISKVSKLLAQKCFVCLLKECGGIICFLILNH